MASAKVLLIDDSNFFHTLLHEVISKHLDIEIIGDAFNVSEGIEKIRMLSPDVILLDINKPGMNMLETIAEIMRDKPLPVIVFSSIAKRSPDISYKAVKAGAVDIIEKPLNTDTEYLREFISSRVISSIRTFSDFKVKQRIASKEELEDFAKYKITKIQSDSVNSLTEKNPLLLHKTAESTASGNSADSDFHVIGIAASTGGPQTVRLLITDLSKKNINAAIIILQHMAYNFISGFREWLSRYSSMPVILPVEGEKIEPRKIYIAPGGRHMILNKNKKVGFIDSPPIEGIRPAADFLFNSMGEVFKEKSVAVILTGMGHDGSEGIRKIKENGGYIISQDKESSLLYGMPKSAYETGLVDKVIGINQLSGYLEKYLEAG